MTEQQLIIKGLITRNKRLEELVIKQQLEINEQLEQMHWYGA